LSYDLSSQNHFLKKLALRNVLALNMSLASFPQPCAGVTPAHKPRNHTQSLPAKPLLFPRRSPMPKVLAGSLDWVAARARESPGYYTGA
jgi:hypothetical protein